MALLNLFSRNKRIAVQIVEDADTRMRIWQDYLDSFLSKRNLAYNLLYASKYFIPEGFFREAESDMLRETDIEGLQNDANRKQFFGSESQRSLILRLAELIEGLLPEELIDIKAEKRNEAEILADVGKITSDFKETNRIHELKEIIKKNDKEIKAIYRILGKLYHLLKLQKHLIAFIKNNPLNAKKYISYLFKIIETYETGLSVLFRHELSRENHRETQELVHKILRGEQFEAEIETIEEKMIVEFERIISNSNSNHEISVLMAEIIEDICEEIRAEIEDDPDWINHDAIEIFEGILSDEEGLTKRIIRKSPKYEKDARMLIHALRNVYHKGGLNKVLRF